MLVALIGVAMAVAIRAVLASFGIELDFAPFVPAILLASLIAGGPAPLLATWMLLFSAVRSPALMP